MSATDSDNSIDWLASDNDEEQESEREPDCAGRRSQTEASSSHLSGEEERGEWSEVREASGGESPSSGLCQTRLRGLKRRRRLSQEEEGEEEGLISGLSEKDRVFSRKCLELQVYVQPLSAILRGLRSGRYRERLSSFQESVAMDRIQRIMGVLQNPCMGEKYINIILKMEEMLKSWFPNVKLPEPAPTHAEDGLPTKRLKLSPPAAVASSDPSPGTKSLRVTDLTPPAAYSASNLKWLHTSPICSPAAAEQAPPASPRLAAPRAPLTQDNAVSSSTDTNAQPPARGPPAPAPPPPPPPPPPGKISAPCLERLLKSTESIITRKGSALTDSSWS